MKHTLMLVELTTDQIERAKAENGQKKQITHALLCGPHGQIFGTERHCRKYYDVWSRIFPHVFCQSVEVESAEVHDFASTFNLVNILIAANDSGQPPLHQSAQIVVSAPERGRLWNRVITMLGRKK